ncbi:MAG: methyltransferase domain-containing protein [Nitrospira sp. SB0677_bin_15]|nr:methyltransferase domain-containing protein [Nitrospira sp. SB0661_bin_20]MYG40641.1 methyltransferase domain-containing protein [Nitrospira sp. SB0677_bin_15]MYJ22509.1 methyltransferase domain-containing protein [Nitrospira sp. SB0673_bin_12]
MTKYTDFINYHLSMLIDETRTGAYSRAVSKVVKPGDVVVDVGCGSGILSFFACRAGARHVHAIESEPVINIAELVAAKNGFQDRITFYNASSFNVDLPEPADVIVTETMGTFGFEEGILGSLTDARERLLKKGGTLIPHGVELFLVPVELPQFYEHVIDFWVNRCQGFDFSPVRHLTVNNFHPLKLHEGTFLGDPLRVQEIEFGETTQTEVKAGFTIHVRRQGWLHGLAGWFNAELIPGLSISNGPQDKASHWGLAFFPIGRPVSVDRGNRIDAEMSSSQNGEYWHWNVSVNGLRFEHSSTKGSLSSSPPL